MPAAWKGLVTDAKVVFKVATKDPKGKATTGITRTKTNKASFGFDDSVKAARRPSPSSACRAATCAS